MSIMSMQNAENIFHLRVSVVLMGSCSIFVLSTAVLLLSGFRVIRDV